MKPQLLLIEDDPELAALYKRSFSFEFEVKTAGTVAEGNKAVLEDQRPAVIVADRRLPGGDGLSCINLARAVGFTGIVVIITGATMDLEMPHALATHSVQKIVRKPFHGKQLDALSQWLRHHVDRGTPLQAFFGT
ncbi:MAG: response regulator [Archangium sp.]|nr:response regulator [Archangium sp.]